MMPPFIADDDPGQYCETDDWMNNAGHRAYDPRHPRDEYASASLARTVATSVL
eukprot:gene6392-3012_t